MERRDFLFQAAAAAVIPLNPPGIRTAGIRMVPVANGKYKVWTKRLGSGPLKVLLLHGGPGVSHEYLEAMEAFLPQAGIEMYYYDQLGCNNSDQPDDPSFASRELGTPTISGTTVSQRFGNWQADVPFIKYLVIARVLTTKPSPIECRGYLPIWQ